MVSCFGVGHAIDSSQVKNKKQIGWDYPERSWYIWVHVLGKTFGWSVEYIAELELDDAIALMEEICVQDQLDKEWQYSLTEFAYDAKSGTHKPLPRPQWMSGGFVDKKEELMKTIMPKHMIPVGNIIPAKWMSDVKH